MPSFECPLCGATSNRKGKPFESRGAVVGHIDAKRDELHAGEAGAGHREEIEPAEDVAGVSGARGGRGSGASSGREDPDHSGSDGGPETRTTTGSEDPESDSGGGDDQSPSPSAGGMATASGEPSEEPAADEGEPRETVEMTPAEFDEAIGAAVEAGRSEAGNGADPDGTEDEPVGSSPGTSPCPNCGTVVDESKIRAINSRRFREARCPGCGSALQVA